MSTPIVLCNTSAYLSIPQPSIKVTLTLFLDVFVIGINFVIRAVSGIILINASASPWIILGVFFVALFLGFMKRKSEIITLKSSAASHRKVLNKYTKTSLNISVFISAMAILVIFTIYSIIGPSDELKQQIFDDGRLILTVPFIIFIILRQLYLSKINHILIQKNEFYKDKLTVISIIFYSIFTLTLLYTEFYPNFILTNL